MNEVELSVVVPVYNNAATLDELIDRLLAVLEPLRTTFELIFVDDGSSDRSLALLKERAALDARIRPYALVRNFGSQAAACAGFDLVRGRRAVCLDADLENCPEDIPALLEPLDRGYDLVCGYRQVRRSPLLGRQLPSWLVNAYVRRKTGTAIRDVGCGMRAFDARVIRDLAKEGEQRRLLTPLFLRRARKFTEVPLRPGAENESRGHTFMTLSAIAVDYYMVSARRPFLTTGLVAAGASALGALLSIVGPPLCGLILLVGGLLGMALSLVGEYCQRLYQLAQGVPFYQLRVDEEEASPRPGDPQ